MNQKTIIYLEVILLIVLAILPLIINLGSAPIKTWDESLFGLRALHIVEYGDILPNFNFYNNLPDHINTKLPFTTLVQALAIKWFGYHVLSMRLPMTLIVLIMMGLTVKWLKNIGINRYFLYAFILVLSSASGWMIPHVARGGEQDGAFASYLMLAVLGFYLYLENFTNRKRIPYLFLFGFFLLAALLTKNVLALLILPGLFLYVLFSGKLKDVFSSFEIYLAAFTILAVFIATLLFFEYQNPGLIQRIWDYELFGRFNKPVEDHQTVWYFYIDLLINRFFPWVMFIPLSWVLIFRVSSDKLLKNLSILFNLVSIFYLIVLSFSASKAFWYAAPLFPFWSILAAIGVYELFQILHKKFDFYKNKLIFALGIFIIFAIPYSVKLAEVTLHDGSLMDEERYGFALQKMETEKPELKKITILDSSFGTAAGYYIEVFNRTKDYQLDLKRSNDFDINNYVLICGETYYDKLSKKYDYLKVWNDDYCQLIEIKNLK